MRKFFLIAAILALAVPCYAANIQQFIEPKSSGPEVWIDSIYNASNTDFDVGDVVVWTIGDSTGDNDNWVTTTTGVTDTTTGLVAGIVYPVAIASGDVGTIALWGNGVAVDTTATVTAAGDFLCTSSTAGSAAKCSDMSKEVIGFCTSTPASNSCVAKINIR